jgi:hypothetical protein
MRSILTKHQRVLLAYYLALTQSLNEDYFYRSLERISAETGIPKRTVQRGNDRLQELGTLVWISGNGNRATGVRGQPSFYKLDRRAALLTASG